MNPPIIGHYYASIFAEDGEQAPSKSADGKAIGIELGINHFAMTSDGSKFDNPKWIEKHERNLRAKQKRLARREKGSNNRNKTRKQVSRVHKKISDCRLDLQHKLSPRIIHENQVVCVENLAVKNRVKKRCDPAPFYGTRERAPRHHNLAKAISQVGWGQFCTMLKYKADWEGKVYQESNRFFPSSKTCNVCLNQVRNLPLEVRSWRCEKCGTKHDRDVNAAKNIRDEGLRILRVHNSGVSLELCTQDNPLEREKLPIVQM